MFTLVVHTFVFAFGGEQKHIPLIIVGNAYHAVEIEKGNPPALAQRDGKRRILFVNKLQPEPTTIIEYFKSGGTTEANPCPAHFSHRETGMNLRCQKWLTVFPFHGIYPPYSCRLLSAICLIASSIFPSSFSASCITSIFSDSSVVYV